ncbi:MAG TPA: DUF4384 domain-containing protein [Gemmatimonadaceae bacterium]
MLSVLLVPLMLAGVATGGVPAPTHANAADPAPAVRVSLDRSVYQRGDQAHVQIDVRDDGYLVVMRVSPDGLVRVLFPLDPTDDNFVRGGKSYEMVGRDGGSAFTVSSNNSGNGVVYAAWSAQQFRFDDFARDGHWDYTVLGDSAMAQDPETGLTNLIGRMATAHFDYDLQSYSTQQVVAYSGRNYYMYPDYGYNPYYGYDPYYDPFYDGYGPFYGGFISVGFGDPFFFQPFFTPFPPSVFFARPFFFNRPFFNCFNCVVFNRPRTFAPFTPFRFKGDFPGGRTVVGVQYRPRTGFANSAFDGRPGMRFAGMTVGGVHGFTRQPALRPADVVGGRRVPTSLRMPNGGSRFDGPTVFGPGRRAAFTGTRAVPDRPRFEPTMRAPEPMRGNAEPRTRVAEPPSRASSPGSRVSSPPTRVNSPRGRPFEVSPQRPNFQPGMRAEPAERVPAPRMESPRIESPRMQAPRMESPRFEGTRTEPRMAEPRMEPRMAEPRMSAPRESSPRMSAPRMSAPRMSAPRMSAPRGGGGGGGGGGRHHG